MADHQAKDRAEWSVNRCSPSRSGCRVNKLLVATTVAVICGTLLGVALRPLELDDYVINWIEIWGELFIRMFKAVTLPIVLSCVIVGITGMEGNVGSLGLASLIYIVYTTCSCVLISMCMHLIIRPGHAYVTTAGATEVDALSHDQSYEDLWFDILRNIFPDNVVAATLHTVYTSKTTISTTDTDSLNSTNATDVIESKQIKRRYSINTIGVVVIAIVLAYAIRAKKEKAEPLKQFFTSLSEVCFAVVDLILYYSPIGVCSLIASSLLKAPDLGGTVATLTYFLITAVASSLFHAFVFIPLTYVVVVRENPLKFYRRILGPLIEGFAPPSALVTMAILLDKAEKTFRTRREVADFFYPVAAALNKNGSTLSICSSVLFIAECNDVQFDAANLCMIAFLVIILGAATPTIPSGSIFVIILVTSFLQLPVEQVLGQLFTIEWLVDRLRATGNSIGNSFGVQTVDAIAKKLSTQRAPAANTSKNSLSEIECCCVLSKPASDGASDCSCDAKQPLSAHASERDPVVIV